MGAVVEVPAAGAPWRVEVGSESSYVFLGHEVAGFHAVCQGPPPGGLCAVTLDRSLLGSLAEAVGVLLAHPALSRWREPRGWTIQSAERGAWTLTGPALMYFEDAGAQGAGLSRTLEVEHRWLAGLRAAAAGPTS